MLSPTPAALLAQSFPTASEILAEDDSGAVARLGDVSSSVRLDPPTGIWTAVRWAPHAEQVAHAFFAANALALLHLEVPDAL